MDLLDRALALSFERMSAPPMLPFALVEHAGGGLECLTLVTDRSDKAAHLGRRLVRAKADASAYAIAIDAFVRRDEERLDAVIVEASRRGEGAARIVAQAYRTVGGAVERLGDPVALGARPSELEPPDPFTLDWGAISPDLYSEARRLAVHVVNHDLESDANVERTLRFLRARLRHHAPHLPPGTTQLVHFDDRGQSVGSDVRARLVGALGPSVPVRFTSEGAP